MATLQDLKAQMNSVPDHKMNHDRPMKGAVSAKKHSMAEKMGSPRTMIRKIKRGMIK